MKWLFVPALDAGRQLIELLPDVLDVIEAVPRLHFADELLVEADDVQLHCLLLKHFFRQTNTLNVFFATVLSVAGPQVLHKGVHLAQARYQVVDVLVFGVDVVLLEHVLVVVVH